MYRHLPKAVSDTLKTTCKYCHKTPAQWTFVGSEKICLHCGTRHHNSAISAAVENTNTRPVKAQ